MFTRWQNPCPLSDDDRQLLVRVSRSGRIDNYDSHPCRERDFLDALVKLGLLTVERRCNRRFGWCDRYTLTPRGTEIAEAEIAARREAARQMRSGGGVVRVEGRG